MKINLFIYQNDRLFKPDQMQSKSKLYDLPIKISFFEPLWCHPVPPVPRMGCAPKFFPKSCPLVYPSCTINISKVILQKKIHLKPPPLNQICNQICFISNMKHYLYTESFILVPFSFFYLNSSTFHLHTSADGNGRSDSGR